MKRIAKYLTALLPIAVIAGLWYVADDRQQSDRLQQALRNVPAIQISQAESVSTQPEIGLGETLLRALLPAMLG